VHATDPGDHPATDGAMVAWRFGRGAVAHPPDRNVVLTEFSTGAAFVFRRTGLRPSTDAATDAGGGGGS